MKEFFIDLVNDYSERFTLAKFMNFDTDNYDPLTSYVLNNIGDIPPAGKMRVDGLDFRPDVLSFVLYGSTQYWWVLMLYNGFLTVDDIKTGMEIKYPDMSDLEDMYFSLKIRQGEDE